MLSKTNHRRYCVNTDRISVEATPHAAYPIARCNDFRVFQRDTAACDFNARILILVSRFIALIIEQIYSVSLLSRSRSAKSIHSTKDDLEAGPVHPKSSIKVRPVTRVRRLPIKTKLEEEALPLTSFDREWYRDELACLISLSSFDEETNMPTAENVLRLTRRVSW